MPIKEMVTFTFEDEAQRKRFYDRLEASVETASSGLGRPNIVAETLRSWPACSDGRDGMSASVVGEIMAQAASEIDKLELQLRVGPLHQSDGAELLDRLGDTPAHPPQLYHPFRYARTVGDALARACTKALEAGDVERSKRFADARRCVSELYSGNIT